MRYADDFVVLCKSREQAERAHAIVEELLAACLAQAQAAPTIGSLRGIEGAGSRAYFAVLRSSLRADMGFEKRRRRPPPDPVNALLSLGYTLLGQGIMAALETVGLDPCEGFFHADKYGRPALALDLVEEFRGPVVDSVVRTLVNKRIVGPRDFAPGPRGALYCNGRGLHKFFTQYSARLATQVKHPLLGRPLTYQKCLQVQARILARAVKGELPGYVPFVTR